MSVVRHRPHRMLLEGADDARVVQALGGMHGIYGFDCWDCGGIDALVSSITTEASASDVRSLGIVVDANHYPDRRWQKVREPLRKLGYTMPRSPDAGGSILPPPNPTLSAVGLWMMPDNVSPGALEDFVCALLPDGDQLMPLAVEAVARVPPGQRLFPENAVGKAQLYTWLAWQKRPGRRPGSAIEMQFLNARAPAALAFCDWMRRLIDAAGGPAGAAERPSDDSG